MLFCRLKIFLKLLACALFLTSLSGLSLAAIILDPTDPVISGTGVGSQLTILTIQEAGGGPPTGMASGCVGWSGAADTIGGCASPFDGGDESTGASQTLTRTFGEIGWTTPSEIGLIFNANEPSGNAITLDNLSLFFFQPDDTLFFEAMLAAPVAFSDTDTGTGSSGFLFRLDGPQQLSVLPLFTSLADPNNRVGAGMAVSNAQGGPETLFVVNTEDLSAIPEPASLLLTGTGLLGLASLVVRRRANKRTGRSIAR